jgi:uncharacterized membrane protein
MVRAGRDFAAPSHVHDELPDPRHLLDGSANAVESHQGLGPQFFVDSHICFPFGVSITPFSTQLLAEFTAYRVALVVYRLNSVFLGTTLYLAWVCASKTRLVKADMPADVPLAIKRRIVIAQSFYAFGALLCVINTHWSIAFIVVVQLNYAIAPRWRRRSG